VNQSLGSARNDWDRGISEDAILGRQAAGEFERGNAEADPGSALKQSIYSGVAYEHKYEEEH